MALTPGLQLPFGVQPVNPVPVDSYSGPYSALTESAAITSANSSIPSALRFQSMEVRLIYGPTGSAVPYKYWYYGGTSDTDLVLKTDTPIQLTYSELTTKILGSELIPGQQYLITDYQTIHQIYLTTDINSGPIEPILATAISVNKLSSQAYQPQYPDDIIFYDPLDSVCEDLITPRPGLIFYRKNLKHDVEVYWDFRNVLWRRWKVLASSYATYDISTTYTYNDLVVYNNILYQSNDFDNLSHTPGTDNYWIPVIRNLSTFYALCSPVTFTTPTSNTLPFLTLIPDTSSYKDFYTFHNSTTDNFQSDIEIVNNTFISGQSLNIVIISQSTSGDRRVSGNKFTNWSSNVTLVHNVATNFLSNNTFNNIFGRSSFIQTNHSNILIDSDSNVFEATTGFVFLYAWFGTKFSNVFHIIANDGGSALSVIERSSRIKLMGGNNFPKISNSVQVFVAPQNHDLVLTFANVFLIMGGTMRYNTFRGMNFSVTYPIFRIVEGMVTSSTSSNFLYLNLLTFDGTAGKGLVGVYNLPDVIDVTSRFQCTQVQMEGIDLVYTPGTIINIGYGSSTKACVDDIEGLIPSANFKKNFLVQDLYPTTSNSNKINMNILSGDITSGSLRIVLHITRIDN